jgi:hypothetical protein
MLKRLAIIGLWLICAGVMACQANKNASPNPQPTKQEQPAPHPANGEEGQAKPKQDKGKPENVPPNGNASLERSKVWWQDSNWWLVIIAGFTGGVIGWQSWETHRSVDVSTRTLVSTFRPKVVVRSLTLHPKSTSERTEMADKDNPNGPPWRIRLLIENGGGTAAHIQPSDVEIAWLKRSPDHREPIQTEKIAASALQAGEERMIEFILRNDVPTGGSIHVRLGISESAVFRDLPQMTYILCGGVITYTDDIGVKRKTGFDRIYHIKSQTFCPSADSEREYAN